MTGSEYKRSDKKTKSSSTKANPVQIEELIPQKQDNVSVLSSYLKAQSDSANNSAPMTQQTILAMQSMLGNSATSKIITSNNSQIQAKRTSSKVSSRFGAKSKAEFTEKNEIEATTDEVIASEVKEANASDAPNDLPPSSNPSNNGSDGEQLNQSQNTSNELTTGTNIQRGFMDSISKGASSVGSAVSDTASSATLGWSDVVGDTVGAAGKGIVTAGKAVGAGLQGGIMAAAKLLLGPFWDLIVAVRDKKDGKPVSFWGKENDEKVNMLKEGQQDPYGGGTDGKFATGLSFVANGILTKLATWAGWASLWTGLIGLAGSGVGLAPLLGVSQFLGQIATYAGAASAGLNLILGIFSALRADKLYGELKEPIDIKDKGKKSLLDQYLMVNKELQTNAGGVATGLGDAVLAGAGGAIGGTAKGTKQANKAKRGIGALDGDAIGATAGAKKGLKDAYDPRNFRKAKNNVKGNYGKNKVRTSKAEAKLKDQIKAHSDDGLYHDTRFVKQKPAVDINAPDAPDMLPTGGNTPDAPTNTRPNEPEMSNTADDSYYDGDHLTEKEWKAAKKHHKETGFTDKQAGEMRDATLDDTVGEVGLGVGVKAGGKVAGGMADYSGRSAEQADAGEVTGDTGVEWTNTKDHQSGYAPYVADDSADGTIIDKKKLPTVGDAVAKGFAEGFLPFTILGGVWKVIFKAYELLAALLQPFLDKIGELAEPMSKIGFPAAVLTKWVLKGYKAFTSVLLKVNGVISTILSFGTQTKEDTENKD